LVHRGAGRDRPPRRGARPVRAHAGASQPPGPAVRGHGLRRRRRLGQFPAGLFARRPDHGRHAAGAEVGGRVVSRLVVVSNRVALPGQDQAGGLAVGLEAALATRGGIWFGWSGKVVRGESGAVAEQAQGRIRYVTLDLSREDYADYYNGFSNRTLWPLLHFRLDLVDYNRATRAGYGRVNALFADRLVPLLREDDTVWIHDYHLIPL